MKRMVQRVQVAIDSKSDIANSLLTNGREYRVSGLLETTWEDLGGLLGSVGGLLGSLGGLLGLLASSWGDLGAVLGWS